MKAHNYFVNDPLGGMHIYYSLDSAQEYIDALRQIFKPEYHQAIGLYEMVAIDIG